MLTIYEAILEGNKLKWKGTVPQISKNRRIDVYVTFLDKSLDVDKRSQGRKMAEALAALADLRTRSIGE